MATLVKVVGLALLIAVVILSIAGIVWTQGHTQAVGGTVILSICAASGLFGVWVLGTAKGRTEQQ